jgi:hypothetical protein
MTGQKSIINSYSAEMQYISGVYPTNLSWIEARSPPMQIVWVFMKTPDFQNVHVPTQVNQQKLHFSGRGCVPKIKTAYLYV